MARTVTDQERQDTVRRFRESGMTRKAFCAANGVAQSTLDLWIRRLRTEAQPERTQKMVSIGTVPSRARSSAMRITTRTGVVVEVDLSATEETIRTILKAAAAV